MYVERGRFLLFVTTLAAGGAAGYLLSEKDVLPHLPSAGQANVNVDVTPRDVPLVPAPPAEPEIAGTAELTSAEQFCDDSTGDVGDCPAVGLPTEEGGCGALAANRCADFKKTMKPRVAAAAVACLSKLSAADRCDAKRVELCAHEALMNACNDSKATSVIQDCSTIVRSCPGASKNECTMAMSGLREDGRDALLDCARAHCSDKGILGCEASAPTSK